MITDQQIEAGKSHRGGFTRKQLAAWGVGWPPPRGWRKALVQGRPIPPRRRKRARPVQRSEPSETFVFHVASFLVERGHHDAAQELASDPQAVVRYIKDQG